MKIRINKFDVAYALIAPPAAALVGWKMWRHGKYRESAPAMLGLRLDEDARDPRWQNGCVWVHAVSVGEVIAAKAMLPLLREEFPGLPLLLTTHTETGQATARALPPGLTDAVRYYPVDFSAIIRQYVQVYRPRVFIPMETELWPNALKIIAASGAQIFTLNGKISERSFRSYLRIQNIIRKPLSRITAFCVQTEQDKHRISTLLGKSENIHVTGNCKFDVPQPQLTDLEKQELTTQLALPWPADYIVAGSTHPGEEELILNAMADVWAHHPGVRLVLVPRHPERFADVWRLLETRGLAAQRASDGSRTSDAPPQIFLIDRMGVLTRLYSLARVAIVAGSFVPGIGGHNILEPAAYGVPVVYGPYMKSQPDMARILSPEHGGTQCPADHLAAALNELLSNPDLAQIKGQAGLAAVEANRGSAARNIEIIRKYRKKDPAA